MALKSVSDESGRENDLGVSTEELASLTAVRESELASPVRPVPISQEGSRTSASEDAPSPSDRQSAPPEDSTEEGGLATPGEEGNSPAPLVPQPSEGASQAE